MKKITISLGNNESKFAATIEDSIAKKIFKEVINSIVNASSDNASKDNLSSPRRDINCNEGKSSSIKQGPPRRSWKMEKDVFDKYPNVMYGSQKSVHCIIEDNKITPVEEKPLIDTVIINDKNAEKLNEVVIVNDKSIQKINKNNGRKYLCYNKCEECGYSFFKMSNIGDMAKCKCGKEVIFDGLTEARYQCSNCFNKGYFFVNEATNLTEITCNCCGAPIDMKFHEDKQIYQSLNLFR